MTPRRGLRAPFPWFGGKSRAADVVWRAFGNVPNYIEPFAGSLAVLLARPHAPKVETANDLDGFICNFWRAVKSAPAAVAEYSDWPVNEADLHARHRWLVSRAPALLEQLIDDPEYFDPKIAGWWVWGLCAWIGGGWCHADVRVRSTDGRDRRRPELCTPNGRGVLAVHRQVPRLGVPGNGIHAPSRKKPATARGRGVHRHGVSSVPDFFAELADRLRDVRICCGDWTRVLGRSTLGIDTSHGMTPCAVLLDPPYAHAAGREKRVYREDPADVSTAVREWALANGDNPALRIALCGWDGEHEMPSTWQRVEWRPQNAFANAHRERIWFSPHCLPITGQADLFSGAA